MCCIDRLKSPSFADIQNWYYFSLYSHKKSRTKKILRRFSPCFRSNFASVHSPLSISVEGLASFTCSTILDCSIMQLEVKFDSRFSDWFVSRISRALFVFIIFFLFIVLYTKHNDQPVASNINTFLSDWIMLAC